MEPGSRFPQTGALIIDEKRWNAYVRDIPRIVARAMQLVGCHASIVLTDDRTIKKLNARDRGRNKPTNVLTYEQPPEILLGFGTVLREAADSGRSVSAHLSHLLIHGALHIAGHDHRHAGDARVMERAETRLLARLKIADPWKHQ